MWEEVTRTDRNMFQLQVNMRAPACYLERPIVLMSLEDKIFMACNRTLKTSKYNDCKRVDTCQRLYFLEVMSRQDRNVWKFRTQTDNVIDWIREVEWGIQQHIKLHKPSAAPGRVMAAHRALHVVCWAIIVPFYSPTDEVNCMPKPSGTIWRRCSFRPLKRSILEGCSASQRDRN
jgi:hypothetical protein